LAILSSLLVSSHIAKAEQKNTNLLWDGAPWIIFAGLIGARLYHVLDYLSYYLSDPVRIFFIWKGGMGIIGGIAFGIAALYIYLRIRKQDKGTWLDIVALSLPLGQAIGRIGNFFNRENFGTPTSLPWGQYVEPGLRPFVFKEYERFHPVYFYEAILDVILFLTLLYLYKTKRMAVGSKHIFYSYLIGYSLIRFLLEFIRVNTWHIGNLNIAQLVSILVLIVSSFKLFIKR
jgi:phosphatidylglycerol:prolipoprotein diacylglycerol transferase